MKRKILFILSLVCISASAEEPSEADRLFTLKVGPLLSEKCNGCHGDDPDKVKSGYNMLTREGLLAGGDEFGDEALVPGDAAKSYLVDMVKWDDPDWEMPPKENDRLTADQIKDLEKWINAGAPWPKEEVQVAIRAEEAKREVTEDGIIMKTSGGLGDEWTYRRYQPEDIWAFMPVEKPEVPEGAGNPIDAFLQAKLKEAEFEPAPQADPLTLIRRASYDLTGLPPTPDEIKTFETAWKKDSERAWNELVDRLLDSPHYGERWAQHWLDIARYADTGGMSNDYERSNAWRYRDYVIRALNEDKPYDQFVIEQLAGDELADASVRKRHEGNETKVHQARLNGDYTDEEAEQIVASGFLRMGPWDNAMVKPEEARQLYLDDVVNGVGQTFLSTTMRCFKCHDHKFDPLPTKDYYRMYAAFAGTQMAERNVPYLKAENREGFDQGDQFVKQMWDYAVAEKKRLTNKRETAAKAWYAEHNLPYQTLEERKGLDDDVKPPRHVGLSHVEQGQLKVREQDDWIWNRRKERYQPMAQAVFNGKQSGKGKSARKLRLPEKLDSKWKPKSTILMGGSIEAPGDEVTPGVISALGVPASDGEDPYALPETIDGRRLALAKWIANPQNPLTTRSIVNRIWQYHFVEPIAGTPNNFGVKGDKPTHPELLDWLAADFVENGWTLKRLHKLIMTSQAYRQSSSHEKLEYLAVKDPNNELLAYYPARRLTAEELRDSLLSITGELNPKMGGLPAMPEINMEVALQPRMIQFSLAPAYQPDATPEERNRRTIYAYRVRGMADPFLELFNRPNPNDSCAMRDSAAVSPQVFSLMNSDLITDRSIAFAKELQDQHKELDTQIVTAFERTLGRAPDQAEKDRLTKYFSDMEAYHATSTPENPEYPNQITRTLVEEFTGEPFEYEEILPRFENYQPDTKPTDVAPSTRALADICLLLVNANEFAYIY